MIRLAEEFDKLVREVMKNTEGKTSSLNSKVKRVASSALILFSADEIKQMAQPFRSEIKRTGNCAHITKSVNESGYQYEIRYRRNGYNITVTHTDLKTAKALFIKETQKLNKTYYIIMR